MFSDLQLMKAKSPPVPEGLPVNVQEGIPSADNNIPDEESKLQEKGRPALKIVTTEEGNSMSFKEKQGEGPLTPSGVNDASMQINANISEIVAEGSGHQKNRQTPAFKNKDVINFYEGDQEDLSMLKDIISNRSRS